MFNSSVCDRFISIPASFMLAYSDLCQQQRCAMVVLSEGSIGRQGDDESHMLGSSGLLFACWISGLELVLL